jgi:hypothetical protein
VSTKEIFNLPKCAKDSDLLNRFSVCMGLEGGDGGREEKVSESLDPYN